MAIKSNKSRNKLVLQEINITPLMDVLTVLLFFLIKIFTVNTMNIDTPDQLTLPNMTQKITPEEAISLVISKTQVSVDNRPIFQLDKGKVPSQLLSSDKMTIPNLTQYFESEKKKRDDLYNASENKLDLPTGKLMIQADKSIPFALLRILLNSAALGGYADFQFLGTNPQE